PQRIRPREPVRHRDLPRPWHPRPALRPGPVPRRETTEAPRGASVVRAGAASLDRGLDGPRRTGCDGPGVALPGQSKPLANRRSVIARQTLGTFARVHPLFAWRTT